MSFSIQDIATSLSARAEGDLSLHIERPREPKEAGPNDLALAMDKAYGDALKTSQAQAAILWEGADWKALGLKAALYIERPRYAMAGLTHLFDIPPVQEAGIHPSALVHESAKLGKNPSIGAFAIIKSGVEIGDNARIMSHVTIGDDTKIGDNTLLFEGVRIGPRIQIGSDVICQPNAVIGADGFSYVTPTPGAIDEVKGAGKVSQSYNPQEFTRINSIGSVRIGDRVEIGGGTVIDRGTVADTVIGDGTKLDNLVQIGHNVKIGKTCLLCGQVGIGGSSEISDRVVLGGQVGVADHIRIGENVIVAGKSGISSNVPPNRAVMGNPAFLMEASYESYKNYRRLPRLAKKIEALEKQLKKLLSNT